MGRLRILHISECPLGGVGRHLVELTRGLLEHDCDVHLLYSPCRADAYFLNGVQTLTALKAVAIPMRREPHPHDLIALRKVRQYIKEQGPFDIIHGHSSKGGALARLAAIGFKRAGIVYTPHTIYTMNPQLNRLAFRFFRAIEVYLSRWTQLVIANSPDERDHLISIGMPNARIEYLHYGIAPVAARDRAEARRSLGLPAEAPIVGFVGRLEPQKDPELLLRAMGIVVRKCPHVCLAMCGTGSLEPSLKGLASELGLDSNICWLGYRDGEEVMAASDVLALTSSYDAVSYVLIEGLFVGLPIVSTEFAGARVAVEDGVNGYVVTGRQPERFAGAIERLVEDKTQRKEFAEASLSKASAFAADKMVERTLVQYYMLCRLETGSLSTSP